MPRKRRETDRVRILGTEPEADAIRVQEFTNEPVFVVITQAFCRNGHNLVGRSPEEFDGFPGISLWVESGEDSGEVVVSAIHGDHRKRGKTFPEGAKLSIQCPECKEEFETLTKCHCSDHGMLRKIYLTPKATDAHIIAVCDIWGCPLSRVIDNYEMFSEFAEGNIGDAGEDE